MFIRRHYYDLASGETVCSYLRTGDVTSGSIARDYALLPALAGRSEADTGVFEWLSPEVETEENFRLHSGVRVEEGKLVFFDEEYPYAPSYGELMEAYRILTGGEADA